MQKPPKFRGFLCSGGRTRTYGLRVMSPTSYHLLHPAMGGKDNHIVELWELFNLRQYFHCDRT